jgi:hypothetical protein
VINERVRFWAILAVNLTIAARETYVPQTKEIAEPGKLRAYNEMLHRIVSHIAMLNGSADSWLVPTLLETAEQSGTLSSVQWAIADAREKTEAS